MIRDRIRKYRDAGIDTLRVRVPGASTREKIDALGRLMELVGEVNDEQQGTPGGAANPTG